MVTVRIVVLLFLLFYSYSTGISASAVATSGTTTVMQVVFYLVLAALYLLPLYEASKRRHPALVAIGLIDILLGWTIVGWIVALVWAVRRSPVTEQPSDEAMPYVVVQEPASRYPENSAADALKDLARLRAEGALSEEEYEAAKLRVLATR